MGGCAVNNSRFPVWWDTSITLYNKYEDNRGEVTWYRRVIEGCFWKYVGDQVRVADRLLSTEDTVVRIPESSPYFKYTCDNIVHTDK